MVNIGNPTANNQQLSTMNRNIQNNDTGGPQLEAGNYDNNLAGGSGNNGQNGQDANKEEVRRPPYTMSGVLHYLQHEWSRYELERSQWEMERAELKARIAFLQGERKGQENLKNDLVRRIKMLEYSLKQERAKMYRLTHNGQDPEPEDIEEPVIPEPESNVPLDVDAITGQGSPAWKQARQVLRQYLDEIGYSETILDVRSFRVKNLLGLLPENDWNINSDGSISSSRSAAERALKESERAILETADFLKRPGKDHPRGDEDSDEDKNEVEDALDEFSFLKDEKSGPEHGSKPSSEWKINQKAINQMKEQYRTDRYEQERKRKSEHEPTNMRAPSVDTSLGKEISLAAIQNMFRPQGEEQKRRSASQDDDAIPFAGIEKGKKGTDFLDINSALGLGPDESVDIKDDFAGNEDDGSMSIRWNIRFTLRSHYDAVRAMQFHPVEPVLITASEDGTAKLWNLSGQNAGENLKNPQAPSPTTGIVDIEPIYTFRGHRGAVLAMDMAPTGDMCYTGGFDGAICCWVVPPVNIDPHDVYDPTFLQERFEAHSDAIWAVLFHSSTNQLISASADGTIKLWELGLEEGQNPLLRTFGPPQPDSRPRSIDIVSTESQQIVAAYSKAHAGIIDLESGKQFLTFDFNDDEVGEINKILSHPTMPVTIMAGDDRKIRYFDNNTGKLISGTVAHVESISSLAIDPNGLYLLSGSHDGSLRMWNMEKKICLQEIAAHRKKFDMSVLSVAFHSSRPLIGSAGADGLAKVFTSLKLQYSGGGSNYTEA